MKTKAHIQYKTKDGGDLVGVTSVPLPYGKQQLIKWANNIGKKGIDAGRYRDDKGDIGTLAHKFCLEGFLLGEDIDTDDYSKNQIKSAKKSFASFKKWYKNNKIEPILVEKPLVNGKFGGTIDLYGVLHGEKTLVDLKTGKFIYEKDRIQVSAYKNLLNDNGYEVDRIIIVKIPRTKNESFDKKEIFNADSIYEEQFLPALTMWKTSGLLKG